MSFSANEKQIQQTTSAELYVITIDKRIYRYTSYDTDVDFEGWTYKHIPIDRGAVTLGNDSTGFGSCSVTVPSSSIDLLLMNYDPPTVFNLSIWQMHIDTQQSLIILDGLVRGISVKGTLVTLNAQSVFSQIIESIPRGRFQAGCNNNLYDSVCGLSRANYNMVIEVLDAAVYVKNTQDKYYSLYPPPIWNKNPYYDIPVRAATGATDQYLPVYEITYRDVDANAFGLFLSNYGDITGEVDYSVNGKTYLMTKHIAASKKLYISPVLPSLRIGEVLTVRPGCNRSLSICKTQYFNTHRFVGMPYIPRLDVTNGLTVQLAWHYSGWTP